MHSILRNERARGSHKHGVVLRNSHSAGVALSAGKRLSNGLNRSLRLVGEIGITTLSNVGFSCSTAFLASCVFTGNASHGGLERSWMHIGDMLTVSVIACLLFGRVTKTGESFRLTHGRQITTDCVTYIPLPTSITYRNRMVRKESFG